MTFSQAYKLFGPDVETIAEETGIPPGMVDHLINKKMNKRYENRIRNERVRSNLREIRAGRQA
ncbi:hypothetical protein G6L12_05750 [Agrobacterium rhizogenes]|nr:hypothetical protein [Rhizobium rhizogenes]NTF73978.1 hypothetical protein [Rhizobium rhizogenes]